MTKRLLLTLGSLAAIALVSIAVLAVPPWVRHARANHVLMDAAVDFEFDLLLGIDGSASFADSDLDDQQLIALVPHFRNHLNLKTIDLRGTAVTDDGVAQLQNLPNLRTIDVSDTAVSPSAIANIEVALPAVRIVSSQ